MESSRITFTKVATGSAILSPKREPVIGDIDSRAERMGVPCASRDDPGKCAPEKSAAMIAELLLTHDLRLCEWARTFLGTQTSRQDGILG